MREPEMDEHRFVMSVSIRAPGVVQSEPARKMLQDLTNLVDGLVMAFEPFFAR
jgi:hypothetical protein